MRIKEWRKSCLCENAIPLHFKNYFGFQSNFIGCKATKYDKCLCILYGKSQKTYSTMYYIVQIQKIANSKNKKMVYLKETKFEKRLKPFLRHKIHIVCTLRQMCTSNFDLV